MQQEREVQTIYFKDLLFRALYRWKTALVVGVIFALILGGVGMLKSDSSVNLNAVTLTTEQQQTIDRLRSDIERAKQNIARLEEYTQNSAYLQINPQAVYTTGFHMVIYPESMMTTAAEANAVDNTAAIVQAYQLAMNDTATMEKMAEALDMQPQYLEELICFDVSAKGTLGISVCGNSTEDIQKIADILLETVQDKQETIGSMVESHTITVMPFVYGPQVDTVLFDAQNKTYQNLTNQINNLTSMETELKRMLPTDLSAQQFSPLVLAVIGGILGVGLTVCCVWVAHLGGGKVYSAKALSGSTGIGVLGCISGQKKYDPINKWLRKQEGRSTSDNSAAVACDIRARCKDVKNLLIAGQYEKSVLAGLAEELNCAGIQCTLRGGMEDPAVFEELSRCDAVLLAETCMQSRYDSIEKMMQTVFDYNKTLLGCVLIDG